MNQKTLDGRADLHCHTTASDGLFTPLQLIQSAARIRLSAVAITDHDTTDGIEEGISAGKSWNVDVVPGIELNTQLDLNEIHILGYYIEWHSSYLQDILHEMRDVRKNRAKRITERLVELYDFDISFEEVLAEAKKGTVSRPHIARVMISKGLVKDVEEAFSKYIGTDCPAYVGRYRLTPQEGIRLIKSIGGVPVLAHPGLIPDPRLEEIMIKHGIEGIEAFHSKHSREAEKYFSELARQNGLLITGGSDFHGAEEPFVGDITIGMKEMERLRDLAANKK